MSKTLCIRVEEKLYEFLEELREKHGVEPSLLIKYFLVKTYLEFKVGGGAEGEGV